MADAPGYVVAPGDTLWRIAASVLGDAGAWRQLYQLNRDEIGPSPDQLRPGTRLRLPDREVSPSTPARAPDLPARNAREAVASHPREVVASLREPTATGAMPSRQASPAAARTAVAAASSAPNGAAVSPTEDRTSSLAPSSIAAALTRLGFEVRTNPVSGVWARGRIPGHPLPVSFFVPPTFDPHQPVDLVMHLHGFLGSSKVNGAEVQRTVHEGVYQRYDLGRMLAASGRNALLVVPESVEECRTYNAWTPASLDAFLRSVTNTASRGGLLVGEREPHQQIRNFVVTAHSGAYWGVTKLRQLGGPFGERLRAIALLDANYAPRSGGFPAQPHLAELAARMNARGGVFASVYRPGTSTDAPNQAMNTMLRESHHRPATRAAQLPGHPVPGAVLSIADPDTDNDSHFGLVRRHFTPFLRTALPEP